MIYNNQECCIKCDHIILTKEICNAINESIKKQDIIYLQSKLRNYEINTPQYYFQALYQ